MSDVDLIISVHTNGAKEIANLSASMRSMTLQLRGITVPMRSLDKHSRDLNKAIGLTSKGMNEHAKTFRQVIQNQKTFGAETRRIKSDIISYRAAINSVGGSHTRLGAEMINAQRQLRGLGNAMKGIRFRAFNSDLASVALKLQKVGKDAQFVGRSLMINLTAPIVIMARLGMRAFISINRESVKLAKILEQVAMNTDQARMKIGLLEGQVATFAQTVQMNKMVAAFKAMDDSLTSLSSKFGVSKDLVVGLAADFGELGITAEANIIALVEMTSTIEKLGSMDVGAAKDLAQALYFNSRRAFEASGALKNYGTLAEREAKSIRAANTQMQMFNAIENVTALSLADLAEALPELGSMAVSFGLSLNEAAALLAPMKAAGLDIGASSTSVKVSLQRAIVPTIRNVKLLAVLAKQYGATSEAQKAFTETSRTGLTGLQAIVDVYDAVNQGGKNTEGSLKLMSQLFEKRQGPRMILAIEQLSQFNKQLNKVKGDSQGAERIMAGAAESALISYNSLNNTALPTTINNFKDIGVIARIATGFAGQMVDTFKGAGEGGSITEKEIKGAQAARKAVADLVLEKRQAEGIDLIGSASTESGKVMLVELAGASTAAQIAAQELAVALSSTAVAQDRIKNSFKLFAADMITLVGPAINSIANKIDAFYKRWQDLSEETKNTIRKFVVGILAFLAVIGPVVIAIGTFAAATGVMGRALTRFLPKLRNTETGFVSLGNAARGAKSKVNDLYNSFIGKTGDVKIGNPFTPISSATSATGMGPGFKSMSPARRVGKNISVFDPTTGAVIPPTRGPGGRFLSRSARRAVSDPQLMLTEQFARNEASMLAKSGARITPTGRYLQPVKANALQRLMHPRKMSGVVGHKFISPKFVSEASALRENIMREKSVMTSPTGQRFIRRSGSRIADLTENQSLSMARGGIRGRITKGMIAPREAVKAIGRAPAAAMTGYRNSILGAKNALLEVRKSQFSLEGGGGVIKKITAAMKGFMLATNLGTKALKLMKIAMISSGILIALLAIGVVIMLVKNNMEKFKTSGKAAMDKIKAAFDIFKNALLEIIRPIMDLFSTFGTGGEGAEGAISGISKAFGKVADVITWLAKLFASFVKNYVQPYMYMIINIVAAVVSLFQGNWGKAFDYLTAAVGWAAKIVVKVLSFAFGAVAKVVGLVLGWIIKAFGGLMKGLVAIVFLGVKSIITQFTLIPKAFAKATGYLSKVPGLGFLKGISDGVNGVVDSTFALVDKAKGSVNGIIDSTVNGLVKFVNKGDEAVTNIANKMMKTIDSAIAKGVKKSTGKVKIFDGIPKAAADAGDDAGEAIAENMTDEFNAAGGASKIGKAIKDELMDAAQKLQDYIAGELSNAIKKYVDEAVKALNIQKDSALKVFDIQLSTLMKLEKAEESLTKTKAYEVAKRKMIDDKTLSDEQFRRNFAVAVYEGRIDDARMLQLEQQKNEKDQTEQLKGIESDRAKDLAKENLDALKNAINEAKDAASKFFEESITKFQEAIVLITKFPPVTIEDYRKQIGEITTITNQTAIDTGAAFGEMFEKFVTTINDKMPNKVVGAFSENLDALVAEATLKYGLGATPGENTIIGVTLGMLVGMGDTFGDNKQAVVDQFGLVSTGIVDNFVAAKTEILRIVNEDFLVPFEAAGLIFATNWQTIYTQAIKDGNTAITDSYRSMVVNNKELLDEMLGYLDTETKAWIAKKVAIDAANKAASEGGGSGGDVAGNTGLDRVGINRRDAQGNTGFGASSVADWYRPMVRRAGHRFKTGGPIPMDQSGFIKPGFINKPETEGVPAILHGGEYIINAKAVKRLGLGALTKLNNNFIPKFKKGGLVPTVKGSPLRRGSADRLEKNIMDKAHAGRKEMALATAAQAQKNKQKPNWQYGGGVQGLMLNMLSHPMSYVKPFLKETLRPKNSFAMIGAGVGGALGAFGGGVGAVPGSIGGAAFGGGIGSFVEQLFDKKKGVSVKAIASNALLQGAFAGVGGAVANPIAKFAKNALISKFPGTATYIKGIASRTTGPVANFLSSLPSRLRGDYLKPFDASKLDPSKIVDLSGSRTNELMSSSRMRELMSGPRNLPAPYIKGMNTKDIIGDKILRYTEIYDQNSGTWGANVGAEVVPSFQLHKIGNELLTFGVSDDIIKGTTALNNLNIKGFDFNAFKIAGVNPSLQSSINLSDDFWASVRGMRIQNPAIANNDTTAAGIFYNAIVNKDQAAIIQFRHLKNLGKNSMQEDMFKYWNHHPDKSVFDRYGKEQILSDHVTRKMTGIKPLFWVHEKKYPFTLNKNGDMELRPTSHFQTDFKGSTMNIWKDGVETSDIYRTPTGAPMISAGTKDYVRDTIHGVINHSVMGHGQRENVIDGMNVLVANLEEVIKANPGAIESLNTIDTFFTPRPGMPLIIPKGTFKLIPKTKNIGADINDFMDTWINGEITGKDYGFQGGDHGSFNDAHAHYVAKIAEGLKISASNHFNSPSGGSGGNLGFLRGRELNANEFSTGRNISEISSNYLARLQERNKFNATSEIERFSLAWDKFINYQNYNQGGTITDRFGQPLALPSAKSPNSPDMSPYVPLRPRNRAPIRHAFKTGGYVPGNPSVGVPAMLHGGEYVINARSVSNMGRIALEAINGSKFRTPSSTPSMAMAGKQSSISTVNINVDTFIGEEEWFKTMMKDYNINVLPKNQRNAGNEPRTFSSYNGVNRGN